MFEKIKTKAYVVIVRIFAWFAEGILALYTLITRRNKGRFSGTVIDVEKIVNETTTKLRNFD